jgi:hypothetical protein
MARFLNGLNKEIANVVELQHYMELKDSYGNECGETNNENENQMFLDQFGFIFISMEAKLEGRKAAQTKPFVLTNAEPPKAKDETFTGFKGKFDSKPKCTQDVKCFSCQGRGQCALECPNKRIMVMWNSRVTNQIVKTSTIGGLY